MKKGYVYFIQLITCKVLRVIWMAAVLYNSRDDRSVQHRLILKKFTDSESANKCESNTTAT